MNESFIDLERLQRADEASRKEIAQKVGVFLSGLNSRDEMDMAMDLARILVEDASIGVRMTLAVELTRARELPDRLKRTIASDIDSIALPFIVAARSLDDVFLQELIKEGRAGFAESVACRERVSESISDIISELGPAEAVVKLVANEGACLSEGSCEKVVKRFPSRSSMMEALARRGDLPVRIVEMIIFKVAQEYGEMLLEKYDLEENYARYLASVVGRRSFLEALEESTEDEQRNYLQQLGDSDGIHPETLRTFLEDSHMNLFKVALSLLVRKPISSIDAALGKRGRQALAKLLEIAGFTKASAGVLLIAWSRHEPSQVKLPS